MSSSSAVVCREVFDENSQPSAEEISEYAHQLGIDPESESHLLPLAKEGLMQALPAPWKAYYDEKLETHYYYNEELKKTQWEHPLDNVYREIVKRARDASIQDDTCASVQDLPTSEENPKFLERVETKVESEDDDLSTDSENHASDIKDNATLVAKRLALLGRPPLAPISRLEKKLGELKISPLRRNADSTKPLLRNISDRDLLNRPAERPKMLFKQQSEIIDLKMHVLKSPEEENFSPLLSSAKVEKGLSLTGKGSMFLRVSKSDLPSPDTEKSHLDSMTKSDPPKGILREKSDLFLRNNALRPKHTTSLDEDKKSVRFKLENLPDPTISPGSNSSSEQNEQSSIVASIPPPSLPSPLIPSSPVSPHEPIGPLNPIPRTLNPISTPLNPISNPLNPISNPLNSISSSLNPISKSLNPISNSLNPIFGSTNPVPSINPSVILSPLAGRPPLPPRPADSPRELRSVSGSEGRDSIESDRGTSPRRRVIRPPAVDYIKPELFQKNFQKISDLVRPGDIEPSSIHLLEPSGEKEVRPRSPMIPQQKNKISINLMESIDSETSIDSPDKEFANLDLNDLDESNEKTDPKDSEREERDSSKLDETSEKSVSKTSNSTQNKSPGVAQSIPVPQIKVPTLDLPKAKLLSDSDDSKKVEEKNSGANSIEGKPPQLKISPTPSSTDLKSPRYDFNKPTLDLSKTKLLSDSDDSKKVEEKNSGATNSIEGKHPQLKVSPTPSSTDLKSPRYDFNKPWSSPLSFKPLNKAVIAPLKSSDSATSLGKGLTSPRLDGVILSQGKANSDNVVVVYQFESQEENFVKPIKSPLMPDGAARDMIERNKVDERRRLELSLQKELESIRAEFATKERKMRMDLQEELREAEEKFVAEKRTRLVEQADRHRKEIEQALASAEHSHQESLQSLAAEMEERRKRDLELAERQHGEDMAKMRDLYQKKLAQMREQLEIENERALTELREQLQASLSRERACLAEDNRATIESLREEHNARVTELRHDYRAEVERLRTQHACHLEELRARLTNERMAPRHEDRALQDKYRCLKEKYARLKHDVKMSIERRNKRREMSMTTGSETEKSNSHKQTQSLEKCKEVNETSVSVVIEPEPRIRVNNNSINKYNDNETSQSESNALKSCDNNNEDWKIRKDNSTTPTNVTHPPTVKKHRRAAVAFREPPASRGRGRDRDGAVTTDCQDSSDATTTADEKPKESVNGHGRRRCFTRLKSASTSRLNYSPKRGEGWSSPLEALRQQLRKLDDLEDQFPDLACQPSYSLRYPFGELGGVSRADMPELEFVRHRALVEREGMRRARLALRRRRAALRENRDELSPHRPPSEEREATELEVALHRARALLGEKEIRLRHIERALRRLTDSHPPPLIQEATTSEASSGSEAAVEDREATGAVLRSLKALHADVRDIWLALDARPRTASPETSSFNPATTSQTRMTLSAPEAAIQADSDGGVQERVRGLRAWLQTQ